MSGGFRIIFLAQKSYLELKEPLFIQNVVCILLLQPPMALVNEINHYKSIFDFVNQFI